MDWEEYRGPLGLSQAQLCILDRFAHRLSELGTRERNVPILALDALDTCHKQIGSAMGLDPRTVAQIALRERLRLGVPGRGTLACLLLGAIDMSS